MKKHSEDQPFISRIRRWIIERKKILKFLLVFIVSLSMFSFILELESVQLSFINPHLNHVAWTCGKVLKSLGTDCDVYESSISSAQFSVQVVKGCESIYPTVMLWAALLAYPQQGSRKTRWRWKIVGIIGGAVILFIMNIIRVVTMFYIGMYFPSLFDLVHIYAWQALFILLTLGVFLFWAAKAQKIEGKSVVN